MDLRFLSKGRRFPLEIIKAYIKARRVRTISVHTSLPSIP